MTKAELERGCCGDVIAVPEDIEPIMAEVARGMFAPKGEVSK